MKRFTQYILESEKMLKSISFEETDLDTAIDEISKFPEKYNLVNDYNKVGENRFKDMVFTFNKFAINKSDTNIYKILLNDNVVGYFGLGLMNYIDLTEDFYKLILKHIPELKEVFNIIKNITLNTNRDISSENYWYNYFYHIYYNKIAQLSRYIEMNNVPEDSPWYKSNSSILEQSPSKLARLHASLINKETINALTNFYINNITVNLVLRILYATPYISFLCINGDDVKKYSNEINNFSSFDFIKSFFSKLIEFITSTDKINNIHNFVSTDINADILGANKIKYKKYKFSNDLKSIEDFGELSKADCGIYNIRQLCDENNEKKIMELINQEIEIFDIIGQIRKFTNEKEILEKVEKTFKKIPLPFITVHPKNEQIEKMYIRGGFKKIPNDKNDALIYFLK